MKLDQSLLDQFARIYRQNIFVEVFVFLIESVHDNLAPISIKPLRFGAIPTFAHSSRVREYRRTNLILSPFFGVTEKEQLPLIDLVEILEVYGCFFHEGAVRARIWKLWVQVFEKYRVFHD